jgi:small-conductance mechanosensitive channel
VNPEVHDALLQVVDMRRELLDQFNKQLGNQLMMAINLQINQQQLMSVSKSPAGDPDPADFLGEQQQTDGLGLG